MRTRTLALGAVAGPVLLTVAWLVLGFLSPGYTLWGTHIAPYSAISQPFSGLGLGPTAPFMNAAFVASGLLMIAGVYGVFRQIPEMTAGERWTATFVLALPGVGAVTDGLFNLEHFMLHFAGFALVLTTVIGFPVTGFLLRRQPRWRRFGSRLIAAGPITLVLAILYFATFTPTAEGVRTGIAGLTERILVLEIMAWYVGLGWLAFSRPSRNRLLAI
jgi:Protein of unknown function (DUF998)